MRRPIIVTGTGRSGTSTASRILHTRLGVCMGHNFGPADKNNPLGYWEERDMERPSRRITSKEGKIFNYTVSNWITAFEQVHKDCGSKLVGFKHPVTSLFTNEQWRAINPLFIIRCYRRFEDVIASMLKRKPTGSANVIEKRKTFIRRRLDALDVGLVGLPVVTIDFTDRRTDDEVYEILLPYVENWR